MKINVDLKETARRLSDAMSNRAVSQTDVHRNTGISYSSLSQYLSGKVRPSEVSAEALSNYLNCSKYYLMGYDVEPSGLTKQVQDELKQHWEELVKEDEIKSVPKHLIKYSQEIINGNFDLRAICAAKIQRLSDSQVQYISNIIDQLLFSDTNNTNI